jgi:hypothetical protein
VPVRPQALTVLVDHVPALIDSGAAQLLVSDASLRRLTIRNASETADVALGGESVTLTNAAIVLHPGDMWVESDAAGAPWYAVSSEDNADVRVMGVK